MPTDHRGTRELPMSKEGRLTRRDATQAAHDKQITSFSRRIFYVVKHVVKKDVRLYVVMAPGSCHIYVKYMSCDYVFLTCFENFIYGYSAHLGVQFSVFRHDYGIGLLIQLETTAITERQYHT